MIKIEKDDIGYVCLVFQIDADTVVRRRISSLRNMHLIKNEFSLVLKKMVIDLIEHSSSDVNFDGILEKIIERTFDAKEAFDLAKKLTTQFDLTADQKMELIENLK